MARNDQLLNNLQYVRSLMGQFADFANRCSQLGPRKPYRSFDDLPDEIKKSHMMKEYQGWVRLCESHDLRSAPDYDQDAEEYLAASRARAIAKYKRNVAMPSKVRDPYGHSHQIMLKRYESIRDKEIARAEKISKLLHEYGVIVQGQRHEIVEKVDCGRAAEDERRAHECRCLIAEMERVQSQFDFAIADGWYPPAFRTIEACDFFIFAVENQIVHTSDELAAAYLEELRHREVLDAIRCQSDQIIAACRDIAESIGSEVGEAIRENAELVRNQLAKGNMAILESLARADANAWRREEVQTKSLTSIYLMNDYLNRNFASRNVFFGYPFAF